MKPFDANGLFHPIEDRDQVRRLAIKGVGATVFSGGCALAIQVVATAILARLLAPADFGIVTMVTTFSLLFVNFGLNGFTEAILQAQEMNRCLASNLFWINISAGIVLTILFAALGPILALFYRNPLVSRVALGISPSILITSLSVEHIALLKRGMRFPVASANELLSRAISLVASIVLAKWGWGYWALVASVVLQPAAQTIGAWVLCPWLPDLPRRSAGTGPLVKFALNVYGRFTVNYFARNTDNLLVGWRFGSISLGFYKKAYDLFALSAGQLTAPITNVAVAALSKFEPGSDEYKRRLLGALSVTALVGMGLSAEFALIGKDLIRVLLGPGWEQTGRIFVFFAPGIGAMLVYYVHGWIHLSIGAAHRWLRWGIVEVVLTLVMFILGLPWGPVGIAVAWSASFWTLTLPALWYAGRPIQLPLRSVLSAIWRYVAAGLLAGLATWGIGRQIPHLFSTPPSSSRALIDILQISLPLCGCYLAIVVLLHGSLAPLRRVVMLSHEMVFRRRQSASPLVERSVSIRVTIPQSRVNDKKSKPFVSILIPAFNAEAWIEATLRSAIGQTWERKEIIVVDDGSTDRTVERAKRFEDAGVLVVEQENQGAAAARNKAFSLCRGDYIQWLDADDLLAPDKIALQLAMLEHGVTPDTLLSSEFGKFLYRNKRAEFIRSELWESLSPAEWLLRKMSLNLYMQTATWLVSRELSEKSGPWDTRMISDDDGEYFGRVLLKSDGTMFVPGARVYYRGFFRPGSLANIGNSDAKRDALWLSMQLHIKYLRSLEDTPRSREACSTYLQTNLINFYPERDDIVRDAERMALDLGGRLRPPCLSWKYSWIKNAFGWTVAKDVSYQLRRFRWFVERSFDKMICDLGG